MNIESNEWDGHWSREFVTLNILFRWYRKYIMSNALSYYFEKYFPKEGIFVECGSGSSLTSHLIKKYNHNRKHNHNRKLIAVDISKKALQEARSNGKIDDLIHADITKHLPFENESIDGIWNLGVMEHFTQEEIDCAMKEFYRVLKKGSYIILFIPPLYSSTGITYRFLENAIYLVTRKKFRFYPPEISRPKSKAECRQMAKRNGFVDCRVFFPWRNCFGDLVLVARKPAK